MFAALTDSTELKVQFDCFSCNIFSGNQLTETKPFAPHPPHLPSPSHTHNPLCGSINTCDTIFHQFLTQPIVFGVAFPFPCLRSILKTAPSSPLQFVIIYSQRLLFSCRFTAGEQRCPPGQTLQQKSVTLLSRV